MTERIIIENLRPSTPDKRYPGKATAGRPIRISADIFKEGHDVLSARAFLRKVGATRWSRADMRLVLNDEWEAFFTTTELGMHEFFIEAATDHFLTWEHNASVKLEAGQDISVELEEAAILLTNAAASASEAGKKKLLEAAEGLRDTSRSQRKRMATAMSKSVETAYEKSPYEPDVTRSGPMKLWIDRPRAAIGAWYELFPRSEGGFEGATKRLSAIEAMGFDVVYLPPIHPIGTTARKGPNNTVESSPDDPGSPWAIGSAEGGHTAIHPDLGTIDDFSRFVEEARSLGMEVALDYALQCSPDHPWVKEHPEWFNHRPDGTIKFAENPPKKYQDIYPINFWPEKDSDRAALWEACRDILRYWIGHGVTIFRVDNPHTKPIAFWEWLIADVQRDHPDVIFLAEAFTGPKMMAKLAQVGFTQSYSYFTWRTQKWDLTEYLTEVALGPKADYMRPNFWPNTPDILSGPLRRGGMGAFKMRLVLAATMNPLYGIYSGYELGENEPASETNEEYLNSEKYEIKNRDWSAAGSLTSFITRINQIRRDHPALQEFTNIAFEWADNENIIVYSKSTRDRSDIVLVCVNLDPDRTQESTLWIDLNRLGFPVDAHIEAHDEITDAKFVWTTANPFVRLTPDEPAHVMRLSEAR